MDDLFYIFSIGFAGSDVVRALWIGLLASLLVSRRVPPWRMTVIAFIIDRAWPFYAMGRAGHDQDAVMAAVYGTIAAMPQDLAYYSVRLLGLWGLIHVGYNLRRFLHFTAEGGLKERGIFPY